MKTWNWENLTHLIISYGLKFLGAVIIILVGFWLAQKISKIISKSIAKSDMTISMQKFIAGISVTVFRVLVVLVAMSTVGFEVTAFVALLGGLAVGIGLALQGSLANLAGGILILLFKPFTVGDYIESLTKSGTVVEITVLQTVLLSPDMRTVILPNGSVFNNPIINFSRHGVRRVEIKVGIGYEDDFDKAKEILMEVLKAEPLILKDRDFIIEIQEFGDSSINLAMFAYTRTEDFLKAGWSLNRATKMALDANGFSIPYPQRDLHIISQSSKDGVTF